MISPFRCTPIYHKKVWGGRWFQEAFGRELPDLDPYGESWELSCRPDAMSIIQDGPFQGKELYDVIIEQPVELLGKWVVKKGIDPFPLLIKLLDANDHLSVQVHPDDWYAQKQHLSDGGKHEMWYILDAEPQACIILGLQSGVTDQELAKSIQSGRILECFNRIPVTAGDAFFIPAGTVHAILKGIRLVEIQQNSDVTFRMYDWDRPGLDGKPRQLHIADALQVINYDLSEFTCVPGIVVHEQGCRRRLLAACSYFAVEELLLEDWQSQIYSERFEVWTVLDSEATLELESMRCKLLKGQTYFIPANTGEFRIDGSAKLLRTYIPDIEIEIKLPLLKQGYKEADLPKIGGITWTGETGRR